MKVTITAPFARVQVELTQGEAAQLMHMALDWAEHGSADSGQLTVDSLRGVPLMPTEENRGGEAEALRVDAYQSAPYGETERPEAASGDDRTVPGFVGGGVKPLPYDENAAAAAEGSRTGADTGSCGEGAGAPGPMSINRPLTKGEYWGFLYTRCEKCMEVRGYFTKQHMTEYKCRCGHRTPLTGLRKLTVKCYCCGTEIKYRTNLTEERFTVACHNCGAPVEVELHSKLKEYVTF